MDTKTEMKDVKDKEEIMPMTCKMCGHDHKGKDRCDTCGCEGGQKAKV